MKRVSRRLLYFELVYIELGFIANDGLRCAVGKFDRDGLISLQLRCPSNDGLRLVSDQAESARHDGQWAKHIKLTGKSLQIAAFIIELPSDQFSLSG